MSKTRDLTMLAVGAALAPRTERVYEQSDVDVTINRAPTDKSVKLLMEMEEKAREKLLASVRLENNLFEGAAFVELNGFDMEYVLSVRASLNGEKIEAKVFELARGPESIRDALPKLRDELAKQIANTILKNCLERAVLPRF